MTNRTLPLAIFMCLGISAAAFGQASFFLQLPGASSSNNAYAVYPALANPLNPIGNLTGPTGLGYVIPKAAGGGFYLLSPNLIESIDGAFATAPHIISGLAGPPKAATPTLDGKLLLVAATDSGNNGFLYLVDTISDQVIGGSIPLAGPPTFQPGTTTAFCPTCFIAVSQDSKFAYVLTNTGQGSRVTSYNLATRAVVNQLNVPFGGSTSVSLSPLGLLYVTGGNAIYEVDPATMQITPGGTIGVNATPFRLHYTPDGTTAYAANLTPAIGGASLLKLTLATHASSTWPPFSPGQTVPVFDDVVVGGNNRIFAIDSADGKLADVSPNPFQATDSTATIGPGNNQFNIISAAVSNEVPNAKFLFFVVNNGNQTNLYRYDLLANAVNISNPNVPNYPLAQVVTVPPQSGTTQFLSFNATQTLAKGGPAARLFARALNAASLPVFNSAATFTTDAGNGVVITNASTVTNSDGWVQANATVPNTPGVYNVTLTVDGASTVFALTVPGGTSGGGSSQVAIVGGDGQLIFQNSGSQFPLTIQVTDTNNKPLQGVPVTFDLRVDISDPNTNIPLTGGGILNTPETQTDDQGNASTFLTGLQLITNSTVLPILVTATTPFGSAVFHETIILLSTADAFGTPQFIINQPSFETARTITVAQGVPTPDAIEVQIFATAFPDTGKRLKNVGIFTFNAQDGTKQAPASCVGSDLSGDDGVAKCTLLATCKIQSVPLGVSFGNPILSTTFQLNVVAGGAQQFTIISGNNQSGTAGQTLNLSTILADGCGSPVSVNTPTTWAIKSGAATFVSSTSFTDGQGRTTASVKLGQTPGQVVVTVTSGKIVGTFTLTNSVVIGGITPFSGFPQTTRTSSQFPSPVVFLVKDNNGAPLPGINVTFNVVGGTANPTSIISDASGKAQTTVTAGASPGQVTITAAAGSSTANITLTSQIPGPSVTSTSFLNAASLQVGMVPCGLGTVQGNGIATNITGVLSGVPAFGPLPLTLGGFSMTVQSLGGPVIQAPIESISNQNGVQQVNYQTPCEVIPGQATVVVTYNGSSTTIPNVQVLAAQPGTFVFPGTNNKLYGAIFGTDGNYVTPVQQSFAHRGQTYYVVVTGLGQTTPPAFTDSAGVPNQNTNLQAVVGINGKGVPVVSSQYAQGQIGVYVIGFQIPNTTDFPPGADQVFSVAVIVNGQPVNNNQQLLIAGVQCPAGTIAGTAGCP